MSSLWHNLFPRTLGYTVSCVQAVVAMTSDHLTYPIRRACGAAVCGAVECVLCGSCDEPDGGTLQEAVVQPTQPWREDRGHSS